MLGDTARPDWGVYNHCYRPLSGASDLPVQIDRAALPLLRITYIDDYPDAELKRFLGELEGVLALPGRKVGLIDLTRAVVGTAKQRQMHAQWIEKYEGQLQKQFTAAAIVTDSALIRGSITAVFWIRPLPLPTHVAATVAQAQVWLSPYLEAIKSES